MPANGELVAVQRLRTPASVASRIRVWARSTSRPGCSSSARAPRSHRSRPWLWTATRCTSRIRRGTPSCRRCVLRAIDARTGRDVQVPAVSGEVSRVAVVDGRLFPRGGRFALGGVPRDGVAEVARPATLTAWRPALPGKPLLEPPVAGDFGDLMVQASGDGGYDRVVAFDSRGRPHRRTCAGATSARSRSSRGMHRPRCPRGGYVIEGGFGPGADGRGPPGRHLHEPGPAAAARPIDVRVHAQGDTEVSNEVVAGCVAPPASPTGLTAALAGPNLTLAWAPPPDAVTTTLHAGTTSGFQQSRDTPARRHADVDAGAVPPGTYFARMTASNACGTSPPSGQVFFTVGAAEMLPAAFTRAVGLDFDASGFGLGTRSWRDAMVVDDGTVRTLPSRRGRARPRRAARARSSATL